VGAPVDTVPMPLPAIGADAADAIAAAAVPQAKVATPTQSVPLAFTGTGSEYFRIWIVNLLLTLLTLGFYYPFAKVRRLRYFYANTLVGRHALGFHASPRKMLRGYLLASLMFVLYAVADMASKLTGLLALLIVAAIWPALLRSSLRFRLANTSWRGLRSSSGMMPHCTSRAAPAPIISTRPVGCSASAGATCSRSMTRKPIACPVIAWAWPITSPAIIQARMRGSL